jgi:hypothetical protein
MPITFSSQDVNLISFPHADAMVVTVHIDRWNITKILIDNGSKAEILFLATFDKIGFDRKQLKESSKPSMASAVKESSRSGQSHSRYPSALPKIIAQNTSFSMLSMSKLLCRRKRSVPRSFVPVRAENPRLERRAHRRSLPRRRSQGGSGSRRMSSPWRRPSRSMAWHEGHMSRSHLWDTKIFINLIRP